MHGGSSPQAKRSAKERLLELREPALVALAKVLRNPKADDATKVRAALGILDRTGLGPNIKLDAEVSVQPWQRIVAGLLGEGGGHLGDYLTEEQREAIERGDQAAMERELRTALARIRELERGEVIEAEWTEERTPVPRELPPAVPAEVETRAASDGHTRVTRARASGSKSTRAARQPRLASADPRDVELRRAGYTAEPRTRPRPGNAS